MDRLDKMQLFKKVADTGSFSAVGRLLKRAPSSISRQIQTLEEELSVKLIERSTRQLHLTEAGKVYLQRIIPILEELEAAHTMVTELQSVPQGLLRITIPFVFGHQYIGPLIPRFLEKYPLIQVEAILSNRLLDIREENIDVAVRLGGLEDSSLIARKLAPNQYLCVSSPAYLEKHGTPQKPENLVDHNCLVFETLQTGALWRFQKEGKEYEVTVQGNLKTNSGDFIFQSILADQGIALLPTWMVHHKLQEGNLVRILENYRARHSAYESYLHLLYPSKQFLPSKVRVFMDFCIEELDFTLPL